MTTTSPRKRKPLIDSGNVPSKKVKNSFLTNEPLYLNKEGADVEFVVKGSNEKIPAHKFILERSPVFKAAFYGAMVSDDEVKNRRRWY